MLYSSTVEGYRPNKASLESTLETVRPIQGGPKKVSHYHHSSLHHIKTRYYG